LRRPILPLACCAALLGAVPAAAQLTPVQRTFGDRTLPRVRAGTVPHVAADGRVRVLVELPLQPLAARLGRGLSVFGPRRTLDARSSSSRAYLRTVEAQQQRVAAALRTAIPEVRFGRRFQVVLDALTVSLPAAKLPALLRQPSVMRVYPSLGYTLALDRSPSVIGADVFRAQRGADGAGMKIAVVDDGVDQSNVFFDPRGYTYPAGFPKGGRKWTTPKVIVARVFPGPRSGDAGRLAVDPKSSFHGTHVAGIAAGNAGTTAPAGADHPRVTGLSGVAPRAWLGNYRVFTIPTPIGHIANTPEIVAAFEAAVKDGMDVVNFSGGGPQVSPSHDALLAAIRNTAAAGVVPVIAAGNDRDDFGLGSTGSPGTAPDAISVAAVTNTHVFAPALDVTAPGTPDVLRGIPFLPNGTGAPSVWATSDRVLVDVASIVGTDGKPVDPLLCGPPGRLASTHGTLPPHSLDGSIALVRRGICPFVTKSDQAEAAGAIGIVVSDNRPGEANAIPTRLGLPAGMISDLDGDRLRAFTSAHGGRTTVRIGHDPLELETGRSGVVTSFSSAGPTAFGHDLKPDLAAPGGQILSSTMPRVAASGFTVLDGTSMATPHVSGAAALLLQVHRGWTPEQVKSALVSTAGPAWADTARTQEAAVTLAGGGLVSLPRAADPKLFTAPVSVSFDDLAPGRSDTRLVRVGDAGGGAATWQVELVPQAATAGAAIDLAGTLAVPPGGSVELPIVAHATPDAVQGENFGFVVLRNGASTRRVPYFFLVDRPAVAAATVVPLKALQRGDTRRGTDRVRAYRYPEAPFGNMPGAPPMDEDGAETVYVTTITRRAANAGVSVVQQQPQSRADPFYLGAKDENTVQGSPGTPVDVNSLTHDYLSPVSAAGTSFPDRQQYFVVVDSGRERFTGRSLRGWYVLRSWVNDVTPPTVKLLTTRVSAGRPTLVVRTTDAQSGVDPLSLDIGYGGALVGASHYDPDTGVAVFPLPTSVAALKKGTAHVRLVSSDYQESKNIDTVGASIMPNTRSLRVRLDVVEGPALDWVTPASCLARRAVVAASSTRRVTQVRFSIDGRRVALVTKATSGLWTAVLRRRPARGSHRLEALVVDAKGRTASARRIVESCRR
jgi:subtilisin family serine protease